MMYTYLFFAMWFLLSLDMAMKGITEKREHKGDPAFTWMLAIAVIFSPLILVFSILIQSFSIFKTDEV